MPKKPSVPVTTTGPARPVAGTRAAQAAAPADPVAPLQGPQPVRATTAAAPVQRAARVDAPAAAAPAQSAVRLQEIADRLRRGEMTPAEAVEVLIEDAIREKGAAPDQALGAALRTALQAHVDSDPQLSARVRRLGRPPRKERT